ncbi:ABC transporter permease [Photobacterium nomapromontoriensis]|uniref:ABC transporter permease n=1 Tax=Photobacterium nomapromontoriensis TaxID=2910237 RepID=UPI003D12809A
MPRSIMMLTVLKISLRLVLQLMLVIILAWCLLAFSPLDPIYSYLNGNVFAVSAAQKVQMLQQLHLDLSWWQSFGLWLGHVFHGDFGYSNLYHQPVTEVICQRGGLSFLLMGLSWGIALLMGYGLGLLAGLYQNRLADKIIRTTAWLLASVPPFWLGMVLISLFSVTLKWTPVCCAAPYDSSFSAQSFTSMLAHLALPVTTLVLIYMAPLALHTREKVVDVLNDAPALYSQLHGQSAVAVTQFHVVKNSLLPAVILHFSHFAELFSGSILAETIFNYPGLGQTLVKAGLASDSALFMGATVLGALLVFTSNGIASLLALKLTPGALR